MTGLKCMLGATGKRVRRCSHLLSNSMALGITANDLKAMYGN
jgi:hypothetical protein